MKIGDFQDTENPKGFSREINKINNKMDEQVKQLAETLKKNGLAASMYEAIEKAKSILNIKPGSNLQKENQNKPENDNYDITKEDGSLNELMKEVNVTPEQVEAHKQEKLDDVEEEIYDIKKDIKQAEKNPEKVEQIKEEVEKVKDEVNQIAENKEEKQSEEDMFKEEKKIDLTKVFGNNK